MQAEYSADFKKDGAYTFNVETLVDIVKLASNFLEEDAQITIELAENHKIADTKLDELLSDIYIKSKEIQRISIEGHNTKPHRIISVKLNDDIYHRLYVRVSGDRNSSTKVRSEIEEIVDGRKQWYS